MLYNGKKRYFKKVENVGALINMKIKSISVVNYRNIDGNSMVLHPESNYLIGENNLGKSNFLFLLDTVCNGKSFDEKDFKNPDDAYGNSFDFGFVDNNNHFGKLAKDIRNGYSSSGFSCRGNSKVLT